MRKYAVVLFILVSLAIPVASAVVPGETREVWPIVTSPELNTTGTDIVNHSIPSRYEKQPTLLHIGVEVSDTSLPGPKGEMAAGPRTIGFSADPVSLAIVITVIIAIAVGTWYGVKRKSDEVEEKGEADCDEESGG